MTPVRGECPNEFNSPEAADVRAATETATMSSTTHLLRLPQIIAATGMQRSTVYDAIREGRFPKPVPLGGRMVAWSSDEIAEWIDARIAARDAKPSRLPDCQNGAGGAA